MIIKAITCALFLILCGSIKAQSTTEEFARLRDHLRLPYSTQIKVANDSSLPNVEPINVYIGMGLDIGVRDNYVGWIEKWNKKDGKKYGNVHIVYNLSAADVILARYILRDQTVRPDVASNSSSSYRLVPVYAYIIARRGNGLEVLWRYASQSTAVETTASGKDLCDDFFKLMKDRARSRKK